MRSEGNGNVSNEGISGRNDFAKAVKRICEKRDQVFANLSQARREEAECEVSQKKSNWEVKTENGKVSNEDGKSGRNGVAKAVKGVLHKT